MCESLILGYKKVKESARSPGFIIIIIIVNNTFGAQDRAGNQTQYFFLLVTKTCL